MFDTEDRLKREPLLPRTGLGLIVDSGGVGGRDDGRETGRDPGREDGREDGLDRCLGVLDPGSFSGTSSILGRRESERVRSGRKARTLAGADAADDNPIDWPKHMMHG